MNFAIDQSNATADHGLTKPAKLGPGDELARASRTLLTSVEAVVRAGDLQMLLEQFLLEAIRVAGARGGTFTLFEGGKYKDQSCVPSFGKIAPEPEWRAEAFFQEAPAVLGANIAGFHASLLREKITRVQVKDLRRWWPTAALYHA